MLEKIWTGAPRCSTDNSIDRSSSSPARSLRETFPASLAALGALRQARARRRARFRVPPLSAARSRRGAKAPAGGLRRARRLGFHLGAFAIADQVGRRLHQVANDALHVATVISHLGVARRFDLDERGPHQAGQSPRDFRLTDPRGADHDDVFGRHLLAHVFGKSLPPPTVAQRNRDGPLGRLLPDNVLVELGHDLARRHFKHFISSTMRLSLVYTSISEAMSRERRTISAAASLVFCIRARAAASA